MASEDSQTNLRLPAELKDRLVASAAKNNRSLSAEVASRLDDSYKATTSDALRHYVRSLQIEMAGVQTELAVFAGEARVVAQTLLGLCSDIEAAGGPRPAFLETSKRLAEGILQAANHFGKDPDATIAQMREKAKLIAKEEALFPHTFSERSIFEWAEERGRMLGLDSPPSNTP